MSAKTNDMAGDGTTTAAVLGHAIFKEGCKAVAAGMNPMDVKRGIDAAVKIVIKELDALAKPVSSNDEIRSVATIAANSDSAVGDLIAEAFEKVGRDGTITVREGNKLTHELEVVDGIRFDRGYLSPYFVTNSKVGHADLENPFVFLYEKKIDRYGLFHLFRHLYQICM